MSTNRRATHRKRSPWAAWYGEDYRDGVAELSDAACGVYSKLISYQISHGSFPHPETHLEQASKVALTTAEALQNVWPEIACKFRKRPDGRLENPRMSEEIRVRNGIREARMVAAAKSHANRSAKQDANAQQKPPVAPCKSPVLQGASPSPSPSPLSTDVDREEPADKPPPPLSPEKPAPKKRAGTAQRSAPVEDCRAYAVQLGLPASDGDAFHAKKEANNWTANGKPMHDWRKTMVSWKAEGYMASQKAGPSGQRPAPKYTSETGEKERALKEREAQLRKELPNEAATAAMLAKLAEKFPTQRT